MASADLSPAIRAARLQVVLDAFNAGDGIGALNLYTAPKPTPGAAITTQTLLITLPLADPVGSISDHALTFTPMVDAFVVANGDLAWGRLINAAGDYCADFLITLPGDGGAITVDRLDVYAGGTIRAISAILIEP